MALVRIKDIAARTGVSIGTVDRVLHNRGNVAPEVRQKVEQVMTEMGYKPNMAARTLAKKQVVRIAVVLPDYRLDPYWVQPKEGIERAASTTAQYGIQVEYYFFSLMHADEYLEQATLALSSEPDALLFAPVFEHESEQIFKQDKWAHIPKVMINTYLKTEQALCYVGQDSYESGVLAGRLLDFGLDYGDHAMLLNLDYAVGNARHLMEKQRGFSDYFAQIPEKDITVHVRTFEHFDRVSALRDFIMDEIAELPRLRGFFVTNSRAYHLVEALLPVAVRRFKIVGFDLIEPNLQYLAEGKISFLINQNAWQQGYQAVLTVVRRLLMKQDVESLQYLPLDIVVKENAAYYTNRQMDILTGL